MQYCTPQQPVCTDTVAVSWRGPTIGDFDEALLLACTGFGWNTPGADGASTNAAVLNSKAAPARGE